MLRRYLRERDALNAQVSAASPVARWSYPRWWIGRVEADHPLHWQSILAAGNERPPLTLRVNRRAGTREALLAAFAVAGVAASAAGAEGIIVDPPRPVTGLPGFADGAFAVQDLGAQLAAPIIAPRDGMRVLDACAAPGGKSAHLLELADIELTALDRDEARLARVSENLARLRLASRNVRVIAGDAGEPVEWWDGQAFDRILADMPCTASGIVRRHPDAKWLRRKTDLADLAAKQQRILRALWLLLAPGAGSFTRPVRCFPSKTSTAYATSWPKRRARCAKPSDSTRKSLARMANSCLPGRARATIRTVSSTRCSVRPDGAGLALTATIGSVATWRS